MTPLRQWPRLILRMQKAWELSAGAHIAAWQDAFESMSNRFRSAQQDKNLADKARRKCWSTAHDVAARSLHNRLKMLRDAATETMAKLAEPSLTVPQTADVFAELKQLHDEFHGFTVNWPEQFLAVETESIVLEKVELGRFSIRLFWQRLASKLNGHAFDVVALDPHTPRSDPLVTHPHVNNDTLCAGDAGAPLRQALRDGRLADAFCMIRVVLQTYNPDSAYVPLDRWSSVDCHDCGRNVPEDDIFLCCGCDNEFCTDCQISCPHCARNQCSNCQSVCDVCAVRCCPGCLTESNETQLVCCPKCCKAGTPSGTCAATKTE